jgi:hypothetical protein
LLLLPKDSVITPGGSGVAGQLAFRLGAISRAAGQAYPGQDDDLVRLARTVTSRYREVAREQQFAPIEQSVKRFEERDDEHQRAKPAGGA